MYQDQTLRDGLLATLRHSTEPMVLSDPHQADMPVVAANAAFEALTGYTQAEIIGRNCRFLQGPATDRPTVARIGACLQDGQGCIQWIVNYKKNGRQFWNLLFISPVFGADGRVLYYFANQHDLSAEPPLELDTFPLGTAHMPVRAQAEFHLLLEDIGRATGAAAGHARLLESTLAAARQVAFLSTRMEAGPRG